MNRRNVFMICGAIVISALQGCSWFGGSNTGGPVLLSSVREEPPSILTVDRSIARSDVIAALEREDLVNRARLVQIYATGGGMVSGFPEYRLFDIVPGSVYSVIGLEEADVLVGADDYVIFNARQFKDYVRVLPKLDQATLEIRRQQKPMRLKLALSPPAPKAAAQ